MRVHADSGVAAWWNILRVIHIILATNIKIPRKNYIAYYKQ